MKTALRTNHGDALNSLSGGWEGVSNLSPFPLCPAPPPQRQEKPLAAFPQPTLPPYPKQGLKGKEPLTLAKKSDCLISERFRPPGVHMCESYLE